MNKARHFLFLLLTTSFLLMAFKESSNSYQTECISLETDGYVSFKIWDTKSGKSYKPEQARKDASKLLNTINAKVIADEKERLRKQEEYDKRQQVIDAENSKQQAELEKQKINAYREVAVEYARNQPQVIYRNVYRNIYWY